MLNELDVLIELNIVAHDLRHRSTNSKCNNTHDTARFDIIIEDKIQADAVSAKVTELDHTCVCTWAKH